jgi:hypothetical protein
MAVYPCDGNPPVNLSSFTPLSKNHGHLPSAEKDKMAILSAIGFESIRYQNNIRGVLSPDWELPSLLSQNQQILRASGFMF